MITKVLKNFTDLTLEEKISSNIKPAQNDLKIQNKKLTYRMQTPG